MGWFDEQIKLRKQSDDDAFADSFVKMAGAVMGEKVLASLNDDRIVAKNEIDEILKFYHVKSREVPDSIEDMNEQLEYLMRPYGIMRRTVYLEKGWYKDAIGAMLGVMKETGKIVALLPGKVSGYSYYDIEAGKRRKITHGNEDLFEKEACPATPCENRANAPANFRADGEKPAPRGACLAGRIWAQDQQKCAFFSNTGRPGWSSASQSAPDRSSACDPA